MMATTSMEGFVYLAALRYQGALDAGQLTSAFSALAISYVLMKAFASAVTAALISILISRPAAASVRTAIS